MLLMFRKRIWILQCSLHCIDKYFFHNVKQQILLFEYFFSESYFQTFFKTIWGHLRLSYIIPNENYLAIWSFLSHVVTKMEQCLFNFKNSLLNAVQKKSRKKISPFKILLICVKLQTEQNFDTINFFSRNFCTSQHQQQNNRVFMFCSRQN